MTKKACFVIAPIGEAESDTRKRSDQILKHVISPAAEACGYKATRADQISEPGMITSQVIQKIVDDPLVIADLTERNPNVFYELAIRHVIKKPLVQIIKKGEQIPFDVAGTRTIHVDHHDLDSVEEAKKEIIAQIQSLEADSSTQETPISVSLDLQLLRQSDNPEQRSLADVLSVITELRSSVLGLEKKLDNPESIIPREYFRHIMRKSSMRSPETRHTIMEMRHMLENMMELSQDDKPKNSKERMEQKELMMMLRRMMDRLMHLEEW
ncbi:MAG: hypothetical protein KAV87_53675 [Desulfobacteraceae bacterium]|nr:hypothetical protein [Desulfobacteraceae bacterium]